MANNELSGVRKAAVLLLTLSQDEAAEILKRLSPESVEEVSREIASLGDITLATRKEVFGEFYNQALANAYMTEGGLEYARQLLQRTLPEKEAERVIKQVTQQVQTTPFSFLQKAESENLLTFIQDEHPQTIALILAHLKPAQAAQLANSLPEDLRIEVITRMANLDEISPEVISRISAVIDQRIKSLGSRSHESYGGVRAVAELLNRLDRSLSQMVLESIEAESPDLAVSIRNLMFVFDDLQHVEDSALREIIQRADKKALTIALKGASEDIRQRFLQNMSKRAGQMIREEMEVLGAVRLREVEKAQQEIVAIARKLEEEGLLVTGAAAGEPYVV